MPNHATPFDAAAIATRLRETETEDEGAAYLSGLRLDREQLLAVAAELKLTRLQRLSRTNLVAEAGAPVGLVPSAKGL